MSGGRSALRSWAGLLAIGGFSLLTHIILMMPRGSVFATDLFRAGLAMAVIFAIVVLRRARIWSLLAIATILALLLTRGAINAAVAASAIPHSLAYLNLLALFGISLLPGRTPLISALSAKLSGAPLNPEMARYTRAVTATWCAFFAFQLAGSWLLLAFAPVATWSLFVNVLNMPLVAAMFLTEYGYRLIRFRGQPHTTIGQILHSFTNRAALDFRPAVNSGDGPAP